MLRLLAVPAWANADFPIYSTGFMGMTALVALPLIIAGEALVLWLLTRKQEVFKATALGVSFRANMLSGFVGMFLTPFIGMGIIQAWAWLAGKPSDPVIYARQFFLASYLLTIWIEAGAYAHEAGGKTWGVTAAPEKRFWYWSFAAQTCSYGTVAWLLVMGKLHERDLMPLFWRLFEKMPRTGG